MAEGNDGGQLGAAMSINKVLQERTALLDKQSNVLSSQVKIAMELCKALECKDLDGMIDRVNDINDSLKKSSKEAKKMGKDTQGALKKTGKQADKTKLSTSSIFSKLTPSAGAAMGAIFGFGSALKGIGGLISAGVKGVFSLVSSFFKLGATIVMVPFKMLSGLIGMAQEEMSGSNGLRDAIEEVRDAFGSLTEATGGKFMASMNHMRQTASNLAGSGRSLASIYGHGPEGIANAFKDNLEFTKALGGAYDELAQTLDKKALAKFVIYRKALGLTGESQAAILKQAMNLGEDPVKAMAKFGAAATRMSKATGVAVKNITKAMSEMIEEVDSFGVMGPNAMSAVAAWSNKTGVEIKTLASITNKFLNFEDAAESAAKLNQALGMNVDTMKLMKGGTTAIEELNRSFKAQGKTLKDLSVAERQMISNATGLQGAQLSAALGEKTKKNEMKKFNKQARMQQKILVNQEKLIKKLGKMIKKTFGQGSKQFKGFFDAFVKGVERGVKRSQPMRKLFRNITRSLWMTHRAGRKVGKDFVNFFPGFKQFIKGLQEFFSPKSFKPMLGEVVSAFKDFFKMLDKDPDASFEMFFDRIKKAFLKFFGGKGGAVDNVKSGGSKILKAFGQIFKHLLIKAAEGVAFLLNKLADLIENPAPLVTAASKAWNTLADAFGRIWEILITKIAPPLGRAFERLFTVIGKKLGSSGVLKKVFSVLAKVFIAKLMLSMLANAIKGGLVITIGRKIASFLAMAMTPKVPGPVTGFWTTLFTQSATTSTAAAANAKAPVALGIAGIQKIIPFILALALLIPAVYVLYQVAKSMKSSAIAKTALLMAAVAGMAVAVAATAYALTTVAASPAETALAGVPKMAMVMAGVGVVALAIVALMSTLPKIETSVIVAFVAAMLGMVLGAIPIYMAAVAMGTVTMASGGLDQAALVAGLWTLTAVMAVVGLLGVAMVASMSMFSKDSAEKTKNIMGPLASLLAVVGLTLIPAILIAGIASAGILGAIALVAGLGALAIVFDAIVGEGGVAERMVKLADLKVGNPGNFKQVVEGISAGIKAGACLMMALAEIIDQADDFADNHEEMDMILGHMKNLIDAVLKNGIVSIVDKLAELAKIKDISSEAGPAIRAISGAINASAAMMKAVQFPKEMFSMIEELDDPDMINQVFTKMLAHQKAVFDTMTKKDGLLDVVIDKFMSPEFTSRLSKIPEPEKVAKLIGGLSKMIGTVMKIGSAFSMNPQEASVLNKLTEEDDDETLDAIKALNDRQDKMMQNMPAMLTVMMDGVKGMVTELGPIFKKIETFSGSTEKMQAGGSIISAVMSGAAAVLGAVVQAVVPIIDMQKSIVSKQKGPLAAAQQGSSFKLSKLMGPISNLMTDVLGAINNLDLTKMFKGIMEAVSIPTAYTTRIEAAAKLLGPIVGMIGTIIQATSQLATTFLKNNTEKFAKDVSKKKDAAGNAIDATKSTGDSVKHIMGSIGEIFKQIDVGPAIKSALAAARGLGKSKGALKSVQTITGLMAAVMSMISGIAGVLSASEDAVKDSPAYTNAKRLLDYNEDSWEKTYKTASHSQGAAYVATKAKHSEKMADLRKAAIEDSVPRITRSMEKMGGLMKAGGPIDKMIKGISDKDGIGAIPKNIVQRTANLVAIMTDMGKLMQVMGDEKMAAALTKGAGGTTKLEANAKMLKDGITRSVVNDILRVGKNIKKLGSLGVTEKNVKAMSQMSIAYLEAAKLGSDINTFNNPGDKIKEVGIAISEGVTTFNKMYGIKKGGLKAVLDIAKALNTNGSLTIKHDVTDKIQIEVNVKLDAESVAAAVSNTKAGKASTPQSSAAGPKKKVASKSKRSAVASKTQ